MHVNGFINFTAIKLDGNSFLAQGIDKGYKKGVFFEKFKATAVVESIRSKIPYPLDFELVVIPMYLSAMVKLRF
jgi:hypothetical protein